MALTGQFYRHAVFNAEESKAAGRKIFHDQINIEIRAIGDKNSSYSRKMVEQDKIDFPRSWQQFLAENGNDEEIVGTPLRALPAVGPSMVFELKALGVHTVEDLLDLDDAAIDRLRGGRLLVRQANAYMAAAAETAGEEIEPAPLADADAEGAVSDDDFVSDLSGDDHEQPSEQKRGPGRPRKAEAA